MYTTTIKSVNETPNGYCVEFAIGGTSLYQTLDRSTTPAVGDEVKVNGKGDIRELRGKAIKRNKFRY